MFSEVYSMKTVAQQINDLTYTDYFKRLSLIALACNQWNKLPNNISERWIERYLFSEGKCVYFEDDKFGPMVTACAEFGTLNAYDEPTLITPVAPNYTYTGKELINGVNCVVIRNNDLMVPTRNTIKLFAYRLAEITRTADVNINAQKTPVLLTGNEKNILSLKTVYKQWSGNEPAIYYNKDGINGALIQAIKTDAPPVFDKLRDEKHQIWNECMTFLGINNANMDKRERLVTDEVQANNEQIDISGEVMLKSRQEACNLINKLFGEQISVCTRKTPEIENTGVSEGVEEDE